MAEHQVRRLPVVEEHGQLVGMLSLADVVQQEAVSFELLAYTLKKICAPARIVTGKRTRAA
jgi:CBS-domain-containing membrane protein